MDGQLVVSRFPILPTQPGEPQGGARIKLYRLTHLGQARSILPAEIERPGIMGTRGGHVGIDAERAMEVFRRPVPVPIAVELCLGPGRVRLGERIVERQRPVRCRLGSIISVQRRFRPVCRQQVAKTQTGPGERIGGLLLYGFLEDCQPLGGLLRGGLVDKIHATQIGIVGAGVDLALIAKSGLFLRRDPDLDLFSNSLSHLGLQQQHVGERAFVLLGPQVFIGGRVD